MSAAGEAALDLLAAATAERAELADLLATLDQQQWQLPTPCTRWNVRDVATHVISYDDMSLPRALGAIVASGGSTGRANARQLARWATAGPDEVLSAFRTRLRPRGLTAVAGGQIGFLDGLIHHQDIRHAVDAPRTVPRDRVLAALHGVHRAPVLPARGLTRGLRLVADDVDWQYGEGPHVTGPGQELLLAAAGRTHVLNSLDGPGLDLLRTRLAVA